MRYWVERLKSLIREFTVDLLIEAEYWGVAGAGIILVCSEDNTVFLQKRSQFVTGGQGEWAFPGGGIHPKSAFEQHYDTPIDPDKRIPKQSSRFMEQAKQEFEEEVGFLPMFEVVDTDIYEDEGWVYKTFICDTSVKEKKKFSGGRNYEADSHKWFSIKEFNKMYKRGNLWDVAFDDGKVRKVNEAVK